MAEQGYYHQPTIHGDSIVFVSEDDLWRVPAMGGRAERLTAGLARSAFPCLSPDGDTIAFVGQEEGPPEIFTMQADGGEPSRLTYQGEARGPITWAPDGSAIVYAAAAAQPFSRMVALFSVSSTQEPGVPSPLPYGPSSCIAYGPGGAIILGRNTGDPARWKRYRGGTAGDLWVDSDGAGAFHRLIRLDGNLASPNWIGGRIYFLSDHEGIGNVYSCLPTGEDVRRHTDHEAFYARNLSGDGKRLVYHAGADLYVFDPATDRGSRIIVEYPGSRTQRARKFVAAADFLDSYDSSRDGATLALTTRGKAFSMGNWDGPVTQFGEADGVRYRLARHLGDAGGIIAVSDAGEVETLEVYPPDAAAPSRRLEGLDLGRVVELEPAPDGTRVALTNHRQELIVIDLEAGTARVLDRSLHDQIVSAQGGLSGVAWSPDSRRLAYGCAVTPMTSAIKLCEVESGAIHTVTDPVVRDCMPAFDPDGRYLYFLGYRVFDPVYDQIQYEIDFPKGMRPYAITLQADQCSPFLPAITAPTRKDAGASKNGSPGEEPAQPEVVRIDLEGIQRRVIPFPVPEGRYLRIAGAHGKVLFSSVPVQGTRYKEFLDPTPSAAASLEVFDLEKQKHETLVTGISDFRLSGDARSLVYRAGNRLRVLPAGEKPADPEPAKEKPGRESGWIDLDRVKVSVRPALEWPQMFGEVWRLQRDQFWTPDMAGLDWEAVYRRYRPLVDRVTTRAELSDLFWEVQGELGTSHAYEFGGEYRKSPQYNQGFLGVDWVYDAPNGVYRFGEIVQGDPSSEHTATPLTAPGVNVRTGDRAVAINGQAVGPDHGPQQLLVNTAGREVLLTVADGEGGNTRTIRVKTLRDERAARYQDWVERNREAVHAATEGRVGYVHIPDMGAEGYAEFHRLYLVEYDHEALIVDVRWNGGGYASALILEKLARRRRGYGYSRWGSPIPYPEQSPSGSLVMLTNEQAGSDGDIVSHTFKLMGLGPLIGKRTWGGVIGISPRHALVDKTVTTQPEFAFCFDDVGWNVENYGTDPDIEVEFTPQDYV
ncbi:MAG: S41 family peptidase, partial [Chloroflexota bacterium]